MSEILILAEQIGGALHPASLEAISFAGRLLAEVAGSTTVLLVASDDDGLQSLATCDVDEILFAEAEAAPETVATIVARLIRDRGIDIVLAGHSVTSVGQAARIAVETGAAFASGVVDLVRDRGEIRAIRNVYGGRLRAEVAFEPGRPVVLLVHEVSGAKPVMNGTPTITRLPITHRGAASSRHVGFEATSSGGVDLATARLIVAIGRGIGDRENLSIFRSLADRMGAVLGSSRPLVDAGWMPRGHQVGQSGAAVAPVVYLAFGISGAYEHLAGIREADTIIAVNTDARAPIFGAARYGVVDDAITIAEALVRRWA